MKQFYYQLHKTFAKMALFRVWYLGTFVGTITVWNDGKTFYSAEGARENLELIRWGAEEFKRNMN